MDRTRTARRLSVLITLLVLSGIVFQGAALAHKDHPETDVQTCTWPWDVGTKVRYTNGVGQSWIEQLSPGTLNSWKQHPWSNVWVNKYHEPNLGFQNVWWLQATGGSQTDMSHVWSWPLCS